MQAAAEAKAAANKAKSEAAFAGKDAEMARTAFVESLASRKGDPWALWQAAAAGVLAHTSASAAYVATLADADEPEPAEEELDAAWEEAEDYDSPPPADEPEAAEGEGEAAEGEAAAEADPAEGEAEVVPAPALTASYFKAKKLLYEVESSNEGSTRVVGRTLGYAAGVTLAGLASSNGAGLTVPNTMQCSLAPPPADEGEEEAADEGEAAPSTLTPHFFNEGGLPLVGGYAARGVALPGGGLGAVLCCDTLRQLSCKGTGLPLPQADLAFVEQVAEAVKATLYADAAAVAAAAGELDPAAKVNDELRATFEALKVESEEGAGDKKSYEVALELEQAKLAKVVGLISDLFAGDGEKLIATLRSRAVAPEGTMPVLRAALRVLGYADAYGWSAARGLLFGGVTATVDGESFSTFDAAAEGAIPEAIAKYAKLVCKGADEAKLAAESPLGLPLLWFLRVARAVAAAADKAREGRAQDAELAAAEAAEAAEGEAPAEETPAE